MDFIKNLWNTNIQIVPVMILLSIYILPNEIRKFKDLKYAPIYFAVPPFCNSNVLINNYYISKEDNNNEDKQEIVKKIKKTSMFSLVLEACVWPIFFGGVAGFIVSSETIKQLLTIILLIRVYQFTKSVFYFKKEQYYDRISEYILIGIYIAFTYISLKFTFGSYTWINGLVIKKDYMSIFNGIIDFILKDLILVSALVYFGGQVFIESFLNKKGLGYANLYHIQNTHTKNEEENINSNGEQ